MNGRNRWMGLLVGIALAAGIAGEAGRAAAQADPKTVEQKAKSETSGKSAAPAPTLPETWHATAFVSGIGSYRIIHYWSKGPSMRAETLIGGHPITTMVHGDRYRVIDRLTGRALDVERGPRARAEDKGRLRPFAFEHLEIRDAGGEKVEETRLSGVAVEVWRISEDAGRRTAWVTKGEPGVPLRVETFVRGGSQTVKIDYSNWGFNLEIPEAFFEVPAGLETERLSYDAFLEKSEQGPVGPAPILYPDLLHGSKPR